MAVYVDPLFRMPSRDSRAFFIGTRTGHQWCHMFADDVKELHAMADKLGLKRSWFQADARLPHYDITPSKRCKAMSLGAIELSRREFGRWWHARRSLL